MNKVILCGGAGYIGTSLVERILKETDYKMIIVDRLDFELNADFRKMLSNNSRMEFFQKDIRDEDFISNLIRSDDIVVNLAALVGAPLCDKIPHEAISVNTIAAEKLADVCLKKDIKRFIQFSTCSNYGIQKEMAVENDILFPTSLYAQTKIDLEKYLLEKIPNAVILRCATAYGLSKGRMRFDLLVNELIKEAWLNKTITVFNPSANRPLIHVEDICKAVLICLERKGNLSRIYNVGSNNQNYTKKQIAEKVVDRLNVPIKIVDKDSDRRDYRVNFSRIKNELNFIPDHTLEDGIDEIVRSLEDRSISLYASG